jgi:hypothetical protein
MRAVIALVCAAMLTCFAAGPSQADKRVALVVGNSGYQNVARLANPSNDATAMAQMFKSAGFNVVDLRLDVGNLDFKRALRNFEDEASGADIAVVFFAGHGLEINGTNYMIPVDARLASDRDARDEAIALDRIFEAVDGAKRLRLVIIDACRDNPFLVTMKRQASARTTSRGLVRVEPPGADTLIVYAARAGTTADDGRGEHSPFTTALLNNLGVPGLDIRIAFGQVVDEVKRITGNRQEPYWYGSLGGGAISIVPPPRQPAPPISEQTQPLVADIKADYEVAKEMGTKDAWDAFLDTYKTGFYVNLAKAQLAKLIAAEREAEQSSALQRAEEERRAKAATEAERQKAEQQAALQRAEEEQHAKAEEERRLTAREQAERQKPADLLPQTQTTMLTPPIEPQPAATPYTAPLGGSALIQEIKKELKRVGCYSGKLDDIWPSSDIKSSIDKFAKYASLASVPNEPAVDFLDAIRGKSSRVCPLECGVREIEKNGRCITKTCPSGSTLDVDGACQRPQERTKSASRSSDDTSSNPRQNIQREPHEITLGPDGKIPLNPGILRSIPGRGTMHPNQVVLVDDGSSYCPQGWLKQVRAGIKGVKGSRPPIECVPRR